MVAPLGTRAFPKSAPAMAHSGFDGTDAPVGPAGGRGDGKRAVSFDAILGGLLDKVERASPHERNDGPNEKAARGSREPNVDDAAPKRKRADRGNAATAPGEPGAAFAFAAVAGIPPAPPQAPSGELTSVLSAASVAGPNVGNHQDGKEDTEAAAFSNCIGGNELVWSMAGTQEAPRNDGFVEGGIVDDKIGGYGLVGDGRGLESPLLASAAFSVPLAHRFATSTLVPLASGAVGQSAETHARSAAGMPTTQAWLAGAPQFDSVHAEFIGFETPSIPGDILQPAAKAPFARVAGLPDLIARDAALDSALESALNSAGEGSLQADVARGAQRATPSLRDAFAPSSQALDGSVRQNLVTLLRQGARPGESAGDLNLMNAADAARSEMPSFAPASESTESRPGTPSMTLSGAALLTSQSGLEASARAREAAGRIFLPRRDMAALHTELAGLKAAMTQLLTDEDVLTDSRFGDPQPFDVGSRTAQEARDFASSFATAFAPSIEHEGGRSHAGAQGGAGERERESNASGSQATMSDAFAPSFLSSANGARTDGSDATTSRSEGIAVRNISQATLSRIQDRALELQARGGGMAKVVIRDARLGEVDLRVNMNGEGRIQVEINAADPRVREELEKGIEDLRSSLEKGHLSVGDVKVTGEARKADTGSGEGAPRDPWQQGQSQQGMPGGSRQQGNTPQGGSQDWAFGSPQQGSIAGGGKKSSPVDNPAPALRQRIVQRGENGSLKVFA